MTIRRRIVVGTAIAATATLLISGCGRTADTGTGTGPIELTDGPATGTVTIWAQGTEGEALKDFIKPFEEANPDVTVKVTPVPWDSAFNKYQTSIAGGTTPDIGMLGTDWMAGFSSALTATPDAVDTSDMFEGNVASTEFDGLRYGVPWYVESRVIFYRTDLMKQAGFDEFPTDWAGFTALAKAYKEKTGADFAISLPASGFNSFINVYPFALSNNADVISADGSEWTFDTPELAGGLEYVSSLFAEGLADANPDAEAGSTTANFVDGSVPMFISGPWDIPGLRAAGGDGFDEKFGVAQIPASPTGTSTSLVSGCNLVVFEGAKNPDAAWKLIQWLTQPDVQVEWFKAVNDLPSQHSAWDSSVLANDPKVATFGSQLQSVKTLPTSPTWPQVSGAADTEWEKIVRGGESVDDALAAIQSTADDLGTDQ